MLSPERRLSEIEPLVTEALAQAVDRHAETLGSLSVTKVLAM